MKTLFAIIIFAILSYIGFTTRSTDVLLAIIVILGVIALVWLIDSRIEAYHKKH